MRKTPLRRGRPLKATRSKQWRRAPEDRTDGDEAEHVLRRDGICIIAILHRRGWLPYHECRTIFGEHFNPDYHRLTIEHVKPEARMGLRANSSKSAEAKRGDGQRRWMVASCPDANVNGLTSKHRPLVRRYLQELEEQGRL